LGDKSTQKEVHELVKKALTTKKDNILLTKLGSRKRQYINLANNEYNFATSTSKSTPRNRSITHIIKDNSKLKKEDWINIIKSSNTNNKAKVRLNALKQKITTIDQKLD
jgi:hypothetical protein